MGELSARGNKKVVVLSDSPPLTRVIARMTMTGRTRRTACSSRRCRHQIVAVSVDQAHGVTARRTLHAWIVLVVMHTSFAVTKGTVVFCFETGYALCEFWDLVCGAAADAVTAEYHHATHGGRGENVSVKND